MIIPHPDIINESLPLVGGACYDHTVNTPLPNHHHEIKLSQPKTSSGPRWLRRHSDASIIGAGVDRVFSA